MKNTRKKSDVFPLWALFVALGCIGATGLFLNSRLTNVKKTEITDYSLSL
jgi:hypothetical protein